MRMIIVSLVFSIGVVLRGVLGADVVCFVEKEMALSREMDKMASVSGICSKMKLFTSEINDAGRTCGLKNTDASKLDAFADEFCTADSDLYKKFVEKKSCLSNNVMIFLDCAGTLMEHKKKSPKEFAAVYIQLCKDNSFQHVFECINNRYRERCGESVLQVVKGFTDAYSSYTSSLCLDISGSPSMASLSWSMLMGLLIIYFL